MDFFFIKKTFIQAPYPPPHNGRVCDHNVVMPAFPQEKISHYTTANHIPRYTHARKIFSSYILAGEIFHIAESCSEKLFIGR